MQATKRRRIAGDDWVKITAGGKEDLVYVGRGSHRWGVPCSRWANPFRIGVDGTRRGVMKLYEDMAVRTFGKEEVAQLRGKTLLCHCDATEECHADVLIMMADEEVHEEKKRGCWTTRRWRTVCR